MFDPSPQATAGTHARVEVPPRPTHPSVNGLRLLALAEEIERPTLGLGFDIGTWHSTVKAFKAQYADMPRILKQYLKEHPTECGTICCIGGTAEVMLGLPIRSRCGPRTEFPELGLDRLRASALFYDWRGEPTRERCAAVVRHLAYTGEVDWSVSARGGT